MLFRLFIIAIALWQLVAVARRWSRTRNRVPLMLWALAWVGIAGLAFAIERIDWLSQRLGVGRAADLALYLGALSFMWLLWRLTLRVEHLDEQLTRLTRALALSEHEREQK